MVLLGGRGRRRLGLPYPHPLNAAKWRQHAGDLDDRLHFIEIADPDQG